MLSSLCVVTGNELDCGCPTPDHLASVYSARRSRASDLSRFDSEFCSTPLFIWADCNLDAFGVDVLASLFSNTNLLLFFVSVEVGHYLLGCQSVNLRFLSFDLFLIVAMGHRT